MKLNALEGLIFFDDELYLHDCETGHRFVWMPFERHCLFAEMLFQSARKQRTLFEWKRFGYVRVWGQDA
ncbi:MAG: hypothetical protein BHV62_01315 [Eggerthella sp. 51_9]|nr:MAG: hypothetical protein BHV62_01315 [Eggerthella sp. 51_9]